MRLIISAVIAGVVMFAGRVGKHASGTHLHQVAAKFIFQNTVLVAAEEHQVPQDE